MIGLKSVMITFTLWVLSLNNDNKFHLPIGLSLFSWLLLLHLGLSTKSLFAENMSGLFDILIVAITLSFLILEDITPQGSMMYAVFLPAPIWLGAHIITIYKLLIESKKERGLSYA